MNTEQLFQDLGLNPIMAVTLMESLDLVPESLNDPYSFSKLQSIVDFLKQYPEDTQRFIIRRATVGKQDKLKVLFEYSSLLKEKTFYEEVSDKIKKEKSVVETTGDLSKVQELNEQQVRNDLKINQLKEELDIYHK